LRYGKFSLKFRKWHWKMCSQTRWRDHLEWWRRVETVTPDK
jgi:hypothetical protein